MKQAETYLNLISFSSLILHSRSLSTSPTCHPPFTMPKHHTRQVTSDKLEEAVNRLTQGQASLNQNHNTLNSKMDSIHTALNTKIDSILERLTTITVTPSSPQLPPPLPVHHPHMKLEVPRFDGHDPLGWIFKISQFFDYQAIPEHERLTVAAFYMDGPALSWF